MTLVIGAVLLGAGALVTFVMRPDGGLDLMGMALMAIGVVGIIAARTERAALSQPDEVPRRQAPRRAEAATERRAA